MLLLPDGYNEDYMIYAASESLQDEEVVANMEFHKVVKRMMFKKFDAFIQEKLNEQHV